jgi:hypothetical protein
MLIDFRKPILDFNGEPLIWRPEQRDAEGKITKPAQHLLLMNACQEALGGGFQDEATTLSQTVKMERFKLGMRISGESPVEITTEESGEMLRLVSKAFPGSIVYPRASEIINAATKAANTEQKDSGADQ